VKEENNLLMQLLHDVRLGKEAIQAEADNLINERNEILTIKLDVVIHTFDKILSELPLGDKSVHPEHKNTHMMHQHKSDSVHSLMVNIARRCRSQKENHIMQVIDAIREAEESFLNNEDISIRISELKHLADNAGAQTKKQLAIGRGGGGGGGGGGDNKMEKLDKNGAEQAKYGYGHNSGVSFNLNSTSNVIAAMSFQQKTAETKLGYYKEENQRLVDELDDLKRKNKAILVANHAMHKTLDPSINGSRDSSGNSNSNSNSNKINTNFMARATIGGDHGEDLVQELAQPFLVVADTGWDSLPSTWKKTAMKCLVSQVTQRMKTHPRGRSIQAKEVSERAKRSCVHCEPSVAKELRPVHQLSARKAERSGEGGFGGSPPTQF